VTAWYNEPHPYAADALEALIAGGHIAPGVVDRRSIEDVTPNDIRGFTQCHFFAGIGIWSLGLRRVGWPDDRPIWTGSCPCQPFSKAGKGAGFDDERHLWPAWQWLIERLRPGTIVGEQVSGSDAKPWVDLVSSDLGGYGLRLRGNRGPGFGFRRAPQTRTGVLAGQRQPPETRVGEWPNHELGTKESL